MTYLPLEHCVAMHLIWFIVVVIFALTLSAEVTNRIYIKLTGLPQASVESLRLTVGQADSDVHCGIFCSQLMVCTAFIFTALSRECIFLRNVHNVAPVSGGLEYYSIPVSGGIEYYSTPVSGGIEHYSTPVAGGTEYYSTPEVHMRPGCVLEDGGNGGNPFDLSHGYLDSYSPITKIRVYVDHITRILVGIEVTHDNNVLRQGAVTPPVGVYEGECQLQPGEFIHQVIYSFANKPFTVFGILKFVTPLQICGPFGDTYPPTLGMFMGQNLLYIAGRGGQYFDKLIFTFESC